MVKPGELQSVLFTHNDSFMLQRMERSAVESRWTTFFAATGDEGLTTLEKRDIDLVVSDLKVPTRSGIPFLSKVMEMYPEVICITISNRLDLADAIEVVDNEVIYSYLPDPWTDTEFNLTIEKGLQFSRLENERRHPRQQADEWKQINTLLDTKVTQRTQTMQQQLQQGKQSLFDFEKAERTTVKLLSNFFELRTTYKGHGQRVANLASRLADKLADTSDIDNRFKQQLYIAAMIHDIGQVFCNDREVNLKLKDLTDAEQLNFRKHSVMGSAFIMTFEHYQDAARMIRNHHELYDGTGYPDELKGTAIPLGARVLSLVSDYDDLLHGRLSDGPLSKEEAYKFLDDNKGIRYDPDLSEQFKLVLDEMTDDELNFEIDMVVEDLRPGMVLSRDLSTEQGLSVLNKYQQLNVELIEHIREIEKDLEEPMQIKIYRFPEHPVSYAENWALTSL